MGKRGPKQATEICLDEIEEEALADEVVGMVRQQVARLTFHLQPIFQWQEKNTGDHPINSDLGQTCAHLLDFAKWDTLGDWEGPQDALDAIQTVCEALFSQAGKNPFDVADLMEDTDPSTRIGCVLRAAYGKTQLELGRPITSAMLAAIASVSISWVRQLQQRGEITFTARDTVAADEAKRWLGARGIKLPS